VIGGKDGDLGAYSFNIEVGGPCSGATAASSDTAGEGETGDHQNGDHDRSQKIELISLLAPVGYGQVAGPG
jgi:hypothetical protein